MDNCVSCGICVAECPKNAITLDEGIAQVDGSKCIGCGLCASVCPVKAPKIHGINNQTMI